MLSGKFSLPLTLGDTPSIFSLVLLPQANLLNPVSLIIPAKSQRNCSLSNLQRIHLVPSSTVEHKHPVARGHVCLPNQHTASLNKHILMKTEGHIQLRPRLASLTPTLGHPSSRLQWHVLVPLLVPEFKTACS